ncbi:hypothetical protein D3C72_1440360 [compost metagenome]
MLVVLSCMELKLTSFDEMKEQLGGMYGENLDKVIEDNGEEFSIAAVIKCLEKLRVSEGIFDRPEPKEWDQIEDLVFMLIKDELGYIEIPAVGSRLASVYVIMPNGTLQKFSGVVNSKWKKVSMEEYFVSRRFYKYVRREKDRVYSSYKKSTFIYTLDKIAACDNQPYLHFCDVLELDGLSYKTREDRVLIEVIIDPNDFIDKGSKGIRSKSCYVVREVPKEEAEVLVSASKVTATENAPSIDVFASNVSAGTIDVAQIMTSRPRF